MMNISKIISDHAAWLAGKGGTRANLSEANLSRADLRGADLSRANLRWAALSRANLSRADLSGADLGGADLRGANLSGAALSRANLRWAALSRANLSRADLSWADLSWADLRGADLSGADLRRADLSWADLSWADLSRADLRGACLSGADLSEADLSGTVLDPDAEVPAPSAEDLEGAGFEIRGGWVYGWRTAKSRHVGSTEYKPGRYDAPVFSVCTETPCHPGIYLAGRGWLESKYLGASLVRCRTRRKLMLKAGDKFRAKTLWIIGEAQP